MQVLPTTNIIMYYASQCMQELACIQVLFTTKYAILDLILLNADTHVSTHPRDEYLHCIVNINELD
jgi:hypothetical protein